MASLYDPVRFARLWRERASTDPDGALTRLSQAHAEELSEISAEEVAAHWGQMARGFRMPVALKVLRVLPERLRAGVRPELVAVRWRFWAARHPSLALEAVLEMGDSPLECLTPEDIAWVWRGTVEGNPASALDVLDKLPRGRLAAVSDLDVLQAWEELADRSLAAAFSWLGTGPEAFTRAVPDNEILRRWRAEAERPRRSSSAVEALEHFPASRADAIPAAEIAAYWRAQEEKERGAELRNLSKLPAPMRRGISPEDVRRAWDALVDEVGPEYALADLAGVPEDLRRWLTLDEVRRLWYAAAARDAERTAPSYARLPEDLRPAVTPMMLGEAWIEAEVRSPRGRFALSALDRADELLVAALPPESVAEVWRYFRDGEPAGALGELGGIPARLLSAISPAEVYETWKALAEKNPGSALHQLKAIPEGLRALITPQEVRGTWRAYRDEASGSALRLLRAVPVGLRKAISTAEIRETQRVYGAKSGEAELDKLAGEIKTGEVSLDDSFVSEAWIGFAERNPAEALEWLRKQKAAIRDSVPLEVVHETWRRGLRSAPMAMLDWQARVPQKLRPELTKEDLAPMLSSTSSAVRLRAITLAGAMAESKDQANSPEGLSRPDVQSGPKGNAQSYAIR